MKFAIAFFVAAVVLYVLYKHWISSQNAVSTGRRNVPLDALRSAMEQQQPDIAIAASTGIDAIEPEVYDRFVRDVLGLPWALITDESSLFDFHTDWNSRELGRKISEVFGVDISEISDGNIVSILEHIQAAKS